MTASKDMSRPTSQHRLSVGANASSLPVRNSYSRSHSHTASLGSVGGTHRVNRRKSSTFSPNTNPALLSSAVEHVVTEGSTAVNRRSSVSKAMLAMLNDGGRPSFPSSLPHHVSMPERDGGSAVVDGPSLSSFQGVERTKARMRRASDGTRLTKKEKAASGDLKCDQCGKAYKHGSCLSKHLWEHTPQWQQTSKYLISKHQQVQILEAASVLVAMNTDPPATNDSDNSSSPAHSGSSDREDDLSSPETTPPPQADMAYRDSKRYSNTSSTYSRSYQSVFSESAPNGSTNGFGHHRHWSSSSNSRPLTAATSIAESYKDEDPADLAAAVGLLSCSYGTPNQGPTTLPNDIPPVPPLPEKYAHAYASPFVAGAYRIPQHDDVRMNDEEGDNSSDDEERRTRLPAPHDDDEYMFGKMDA